MPVTRAAAEVAPTSGKNTARAATGRLRHTEATFGAQLIHHRMYKAAADRPSPTRNRRRRRNRQAAPSEFKTLFGSVMSLLLLSAGAPTVFAARSARRAEVAPPPASTLGANDVQRHARNAVDTERASDVEIYSSPAPRNAIDQHLAAFGFRTKHRPQQFYAKTAVPPSITTAAAATTTEYDLRSLNLVFNAREDICKDHCVCTRPKSAFLTIMCNFQKNRQLSPIFGSNLKVPHDATSLMIKLAADTKFTLQRGFFQNNTVNSLIIEGTNSGDDQVEIAAEAFRGNNGPYPEICMRNVFAVIVRTKAFAENGKFTVRNSNELILYPDAFENAKINGLFVGIKDLRISEKAFNSAQAKLRIESSNIDDIYRFEASLREIRFVNCTIGNINGGTFDVININSIVFEGCRINAIKARAITEKLYSKHVSITGAIIGSIESEAIYGSGIAELILTKNSIETIHENAIHVTAINATISRNNVTHLGNDWLRVKEWSNIVVERNKFGTFGRMVLEETKQPVTCRFEGNSLTKPLPGSLNITNPYCVLREISVDLPCRCNLDWLHELSAHDLRSETYCTIDNKLGHCFNATSFNTLKYLNEVCDEAKTTLDCVANMNLEKVDGHFFTPEELARRDQRVPQLLIVLSGIVLLLAAITMAVIVAICYCRKRRRGAAMRQSAGGEGAQQMRDHQHEFSDGDRHIIDQMLQLIQKKYPEIYKQVNESVQTLLKTDLPTKKCIEAIIQIHMQMNKVDAGSDFTAFNAVLAQHLQPQMPTAPPTEPIYSEPRLGDDGCIAGGDGDGFYTSSTIVGLPDEANLSQGAAPPLHNGGAPGADGHGPNVPGEHIYAEPNCVQQPLLGNEYASPADRNLDSMDLYTEPINNRDPSQGTHSDWIPIMDRSSIPLRRSTEMSSGASGYAVTITQPRPLHYALTVGIHHVRPPPTASILPPRGGAQNLPDVLYQSHHHSPQRPAMADTDAAAPLPNNGGRALTNVQKLAKNLQSMPKFQPMQPPSSAQRPPNLHLVAPPVYTAPEASRRHHLPPVPMPRANAEARLASPESIDELDMEMDMRGAMALPLDSGSDHSGGSNETMKIEDVIDYADA